MSIPKTGSFNPPSHILYVYVYMLHVLPSYTTERVKSNPYQDPFTWFRFSLLNLTLVYVDDDHVKNKAYSHKIYIAMGQVGLALLCVALALVDGIHVIRRNNKTTPWLVS
ncbi:hypothetical protein BJY01DRAFT_192906 [Aspergillus pseudoustus]|uniref:Uncharacterized protein n=1 Tax=Aspergillus pseudoustus TaxID=1810923 RepID=A0ABR4JUG4_9EURO